MPFASTADPSTPAPRQPQQPVGRPPLLLALSVHWDDCSVALGTADEVTSEVWSRQPDRDRAAAAGRGGPVASRDALLLLDRLLVRTGTTLSAIDLLCFGRGPGAFTSLRVAAGLVQGLALAASLPVAGICSLAAMAAQDPGWSARDKGAPTRWLQFAAVDARMGECYFGLHECRSGHHPVALAAPAVGPPEHAIAAFERAAAQDAATPQPTRIALAGNGFGLLPPLRQWCERRGFDSAEAARRSPTAAAVLAVAASVGAPAPGPAGSALPLYIRDKIALDITEQRAGAAARALAGVDQPRV